MLFIFLSIGTSGTVINIGWLTTEILGMILRFARHTLQYSCALTFIFRNNFTGSDELVTKIPNSQLSNIRISNRSRMKFSQVKQQLYFKYEDVERIPSLVDEIRNEIAATCPEVITDGSREFLVKWVDFGEKHVQVLVDCRLKNPPIGEKYYAARQKVLEAIARAVNRRDVTFRQSK